jgi:Uma2 family endonuclease
MTAYLTRPAGPFQYEDLEAMPDDGYRREIIGGTLIVTPAPIPRHQLVAGNLFSTLRLAGTPGTLTLFAPLDWRQSDGGMVEPDLLVIRHCDLDLDIPLPASVTPLLLVEILSPSNRLYDLTLKRALYERLGVPAYWIVDPVVPSLLALRLTDGHYTTEAAVEGTDSFTTDWPFPVSLTPADLLN